MRIVRAGKLPKPVNEFQFECDRCGAIVQAKRSEVEFVEDRGADHPTIQCPTRGCNSTLWGRLIPKPEDAVGLREVLDNAKLTKERRPEWAK